MKLLIVGGAIWFVYVAYRFTLSAIGWQREQKRIAALGARSLGWRWKN